MDIRMKKVLKGVLGEIFQKFPPKGIYKIKKVCYNMFENNYNTTVLPVFLGTNT